MKVLEYIIRFVFVIGWIFIGASALLEAPWFNLQQMFGFACILIAANQLMNNFGKEKEE